MLKIHLGLWKLKYLPGHIQFGSVPNRLKELKYRYNNYNLFKSLIYLTSLNQNSDTSLFLSVKMQDLLTWTLQKLRKFQIPKPESHIAYSLEGNVYEKILISNT